MVEQGGARWSRMCLLENLSKAELLGLVLASRTFCGSWQSLPASKGSYVRRNPNKFQSKIHGQDSTQGLLHSLHSIRVHVRLQEVPSHPEGVR